MKRRRSESRDPLPAHLVPVKGDRTYFCDLGVVYIALVCTAADPGRKVRGLGIGVLGREVFSGSATEVDKHEPGPWQATMLRRELDAKCGAPARPQGQHLH